MTCEEGRRKKAVECCWTRGMTGRLVSALIVTQTVLTGCSGIYGVNSHYDRTTNFSELETYEWILTENEGKSDIITSQAIQNAVDKNLQRKGYGRASANPDLMVSTLVLTRLRAAAPDPYQAAYGPYTAPPAQRYEEGELVVDFVDPDDRRLIWHGSASVDLFEVRTPEQAEQTIDAAVGKILNKFPPR